MVRGEGGNPRYAPAAGYRYDGLFTVEHYWCEVGRSGFRIWRYRLVVAQAETVPVTGPAPRAQILIQRLVRNTDVAQCVKRLHQHTCQICGARIETAAGAYAEGAHIRPLGRPHNGPDVPENVLCLCPNDHVRFDFGELMVLDDLTVATRLGARLGRLRTVSGHDVAGEYLAYHRERVVPQ